MGLRKRSLLTDERCFFVTTTCYKWLKLLESEEAKNIISNSISFLNSKYKADILGYVIMPNHLHFIIYFREKNDLSNYMRDFKKFTSVQLRKLLEFKQAPLDPIRYEIRQQKFKIWQDRFDDLYIKTKETLYTKLNYIHNNPLQPHRQLVPTPEEYPYSSAAFYTNGNIGSTHVTSLVEYSW